MPRRNSVAFVAGLGECKAYAMSTIKGSRWRLRPHAMDGRGAQCYLYKRETRPVGVEDVRGRSHEIQR